MTARERALWPTEGGEGKENPSSFHTAMVHLYRGEMNRTEFVNYLIQCQLRECSDQKNYVTKEDFQQFNREVVELLHNFLQFFVSYGMALGRLPQDEDFHELSQQLESLDRPDEETDEL